MKSGDWTSRDPMGEALPVGIASGKRLFQVIGCIFITH